MIIDLKYKIGVDPRGKITSGIKAVSPKTGKEYPKSVDYFVIDDFPELIKAYGNKPNKLVVFFPTNTIEDFVDVNYVLYGSNNQLIRKCNGAVCYHRLEDEIDDRNKFKAGTTTDCVCKTYQLSHEHKKHCRVLFLMKAFIGDVKLGKVASSMCYMFKSGSKNSAENIISELVKVKNMTGGNIIGIPFGLSVEMVNSSKEANVKFPIWKLQALGSIEQLRIASEKVEMLIPKRQDLLSLPNKTSSNSDDVVFDDLDSHFHEGFDDSEETYVTDGLFDKNN